MAEDLIFVMVRNVQTEQQNLYWQESYSSIRKFYSNPIFIVDNGSNPAHLRTELVLENCSIHQSKFPQTYFFAGYLFLLDRLDTFKKAVMIHDGIIFLQHIDLEAMKYVKFFWHFENSRYHYAELENAYLESLPNKAELFEIYKRKELWLGCMGLITVIQNDFLEQLHNTYDFESIANRMETKADACTLERVFAVLCFKEFPELLHDASFEGDISQLNYYYGWDNYLRKDHFDKRVVKIYGSRQ